MKHYYNNGKNNIYVEEGTQPEGYKLGRYLKPRSEEVEKLRKEKYRQTCLERYGVEHSSQIPGFYDKVQQTKLKHFGDSKFCNLEKRHQTNIEKYGSEEVLSNKEIRQKCTDSLIKKYGVDNALKAEAVKDRQKATFIERYGGFTMQSDQLRDKVEQTLLDKYGKRSTFEIDAVKSKSKQTKLERYGNSNFVNTEKAKLTCMQKYGVDNPAKTQDVQDKIRATCLERYGTCCSLNSSEAKRKSKETCLEKYNSEYFIQSSDFKEKYKQTCLERYGVEHFSQSIDYKKLLQNRSSEVWDNINQKKYLTHLKNNSFNISKPEELYYEYLLSIYEEDDIVRQYSSDKYPFSCDFYIKSEDLYIECNYNWTHGPHPFNENDKEDQELLEKWKTKSENSNYYKNAIYTWTDLDVRKQKIAKENNLNYQVLYQL